MAILNVASGMAWANATLAGDGRKPIYCRPEELVLTPEQLVTMMRRLIKSIPLLRDYPFGYVTMKALQKNFPCPSDKKNRSHDRLCGGREVRLKDRIAAWFGLAFFLVLGPASAAEVIGGDVQDTGYCALVLASADVATTALLSCKHGASDHPGHDERNYSEDCESTRDS